MTYLDPIRCPDAPPHICTTCRWRAEPLGQDGQTWHYRCPYCGTHGTEPRR